MVHSNSPSQLAGRISPQVYPDAWDESPAIPLSFEKFPAARPVAESLSNLILQQCYTDFSAILDDARQTNTNSALSSPPDPYYQALESSFYSSGETYFGPHHNNMDASPEYLFGSAGIGYESSLSASSSRPCTAGYEVDEMSFSSALPEAPFSFSCTSEPSSSSDGFPFFPQLDHHTAVNPENLLQSSVKSIQRNPFSLLYLSASTVQLPLPSPCETDVLGKPQEDLEFPGFATPPYSTGEADSPQKYFWSAESARLPHAEADIPLTHDEASASRCVQPDPVMIQGVRDEKQHDLVFCESRYGAITHGKASFLLGNRGAQPARANVKTGEDFSIEQVTQNSSLEPSCTSDTAEGALQTAYPFPAQCLKFTGASTERAQLVKDNVKEKKIDGKYVCDIISTETGEVCGKKFQRSEHLKRHWATHTNLKPYQCGICHKYFGRTDNLNQHRKTHENAHGRNTKLLNAQRLEKTEQNKPISKHTAHARMVHHHNRPPKRRSVKKHP